MGKHFTKNLNKVELRINRVRINRSQPVKNRDEVYTFQVILFLAELLLCYLTGNIFGVDISCGRCADDMRMI